jgi:UDP-glucose 4-epimerase
MKRTIVTGGTGFIGANLARRLLADGHEVHLFVRPEHDPWRLTGLRSDVQIHQVRLNDGSALRRLISEVRPDWIFHLAVHGAYPHQSDVQTIVDTNVVGTSALLDAAVAQGFEAFVNAGTSSEYGFRDRAAKETDPLEPNSSYAVSKAAATLLCRHVARSTGTAIRTLRLYSVFGPFEEPTRLMPRLLIAASNGRLPPLADPATARDFVFVEDAVDAFLSAAGARIAEPGAVFNICSGTQTTLAELVDTCRSEFGLSVEPAWNTLPSRQWDTRVWVGDPSRAAEQLGWSARTSVRAGVRRFADWFHQRPDLHSRYTDPVSAEHP